LVVQTKSGCVVRGRSSDEDGRIGDRGKVAQDLSQVLGTELAGSAAAGRHLGEFDLLSHGPKSQESDGHDFSRCLPRQLGGFVPRMLFSRGNRNFVASFEQPQLRFAEAPCA
jgi:hypothetical protein